VNEQRQEVLNERWPFEPSKRARRKRNHRWVGAAEPFEDRRDRRGGRDARVFSCHDPFAQRLGVSTGRDKDGEEHQNRQASGKHERS
jgi:hypothetical protein